MFVSQRDGVSACVRASMCECGLCVCVGCVCVCVCVVTFVGVRPGNDAMYWGTRNRSTSKVGPMVFNKLLPDYQWGSTWVVVNGRTCRMTSFPGTGKNYLLDWVFGSSYRQPVCLPFHHKPTQAEPQSYRIDGYRTIQPDTQTLFQHGLLSHNISNSVIVQHRGQHVW